MILLSLLLLTNECSVISTPNWEIKICEKYYKSCMKEINQTYSCYIYYDDSSFKLHKCENIADFNNVSYFTCDDNLSCIGSTNKDGLFITCCDNDNTCSSILKTKKEC